MKYASSLNDLSAHFTNQKLKNLADLQSHLTKAEAFRMTENRPFVTISYAQSVDGSIATRKKEQIHLSGQQSLGLTHRLRAVFDTILRMLTNDKIRSADKSSLNKSKSSLTISLYP